MFAKNLLIASAFLVVLTAWKGGTCDEPQSDIRHSFLVLGNRTGIINESGKVTWEYQGGSRDGFVLGSGNVLLAFSNRVEEVTPEKKIVFSYKLHESNKEIGTAQRLGNGNTLITELGDKPRLLEVDIQGKITNEFPLQPETNNAHLQTRMARQIANGNFLVPHLLAFSIKEYTPQGAIVKTIRTDLGEFGGRPAENWPFTAIRLDNGNTVTSLTHGNKIAEFDVDGKVVWSVTNSDVGGLFKDPCGAQRLKNGNTVVGSHAASNGVSMIELNRDKQIVWKTDHPFCANVHHFQILSTNGVNEPMPPLK